jgi:hypothetical protein
MLMLVVSPAVLAEIHYVDGGGGDKWGDGDGDGRGSMCWASTNATGAWPDSGAVYWASVYAYTDQAGWFSYSSTWSSSASAHYNGSGASASGGGSASAPGGYSSASASASYPGPTPDDDDGPSDGWNSGSVWFEAYDGVSADSSCGAYASAPQGGSSSAGSYGTATADVWF